MNGWSEVEVGEEVIMMGMDGAKQGEILRIGATVTMEFKRIKLLLAMRV